MVSNSEFLTDPGQSQFLPQLEPENSPVQGNQIGLSSDLHLRFYLPSGEEFTFLATGIREVIELNPGRITQVPNTSSLLLGAINLRGRLIWVADLGQFLETTPLNTDVPEISIIIIEDQDTILGLGVAAISGIDWLDIEHLVPINHVPDDQTQFLRGAYIFDTETGKKYLQLLDQVAILRSTRWL
ncbi:chemotaxis protein CheW [Dolichospermum circinale]|uniref:chemotaxis protein CheW n=1 Tax=Dolichospermum circinale TaxID=109265 RepID=UPI0003F6E882|nr:chemotaxis protein CheW [Dolichospermum circinale]MDB9475279.1 chemotaxis protein CheW [Dolichospermum circinale CS-537/11]MDB9478296.1 chemotaxis protein CheW [Dolichospermum circinale CS-537/03]MDB9481588.1 chemotaxis protein CheW [Dolichospermum circinale CS-537/05]MDB9492283.1 chemotaxis protein CheW [Dolichospermum circinale CS-534/05]